MIPDGSNFILYAPLQGVICHTDARVINLLCDVADGKNPERLDFRNQEINSLCENSILVPADTAKIISSTVKSDKKDQSFLPCETTLFLTTSCNLACKYCYGNGGDKSQSMRADVARAAVDLLVSNALQTGSRRIQVNFHGGGEPTLAFDQIQETITYARNKCSRESLQLETGLTTNGTFSHDTCAWICDNIDYINVSFDGPPDIQDSQRPLRGGRSSFELVNRTLEHLDQCSKPYYLRGTITRDVEDRIPEIVQFLTKYYNPKIIQLEPMFHSERSVRTQVASPDPRKFIEGYIEAKAISSKTGVYIKFSGDRFPSVKNNFCSIGWNNFAVTHEGYATSCFEVLTKEDERYDTFFYGHFSDGTFIFDENKIQNLRNLSGTIPASCSDCIAKFHCTGDCRGKRFFVSIDNDKGDDDRCLIIQGLIKDQLKKILRNI